MAWGVPGVPGSVPASGKGATVPAAYRPNRSRCGLVDERHREVPDRLLAALAVPARLLAVQKPLADEPVELAAGLRDLDLARVLLVEQDPRDAAGGETVRISAGEVDQVRSEEHTSELQSPVHLVCRL